MQCVTKRDRQQLNLAEIYEHTAQVIRARTTYLTEQEGENRDCNRD